MCGVLFLGQCRINPAFWMMKSLFMGSVWCLILTYIISFIYNKKNLHVLATIFSIGCSILIKDHVIMCVLFGFLIGMLKKYHMLKNFRGRYLNTVLLIFSFVMAGWGHHYLYLIITKYIISLPASLDSVAKWLAIYSVIFVYAFDNLESLQETFSSKWFWTLGKRSMGIYCFHNIFIWTVGAAVLYGLIKIGFIYDLSFLISLLIVILCTCISAKLYEKFFDIHVERILSKLK